MTYEEYHEKMRLALNESADVARDALGLEVPVTITSLTESLKKAGIECIPVRDLETQTQIVETPDGEEYLFQILYNPDINSGVLLFCLAAAFGEIILNYNIQRGD